MDRRSLGRGSRLGTRPAPAPRPSPTTPYRADAFALALPPGWADATTHTVAGPTVDGLVHAVTVTTAPHDGRPLAELADRQIRDALDTLRDGVLLLRDGVVLAGGAEAVRAVFRWAPMPGRALYQQQVYAVAGGRAVVMEASFTARSRRVLGPEVQRVMLSLADPGASGGAAGGRRSGYSPYRP